MKIRSGQVWKIGGSTLVEVLSDPDEMNKVKIRDEATSAMANVHVAFFPNRSATLVSERASIPCELERV